MQDDYEFVVTSLAEYLPDATDRRARDRRRRAAFGRAGEPAHGCRRRTASTCTAACAAAERVARAAGRAAERAVPPRRPSTRTRSPTVAWRNLVCNSAHDSSCACSADEVVDQVLVRYAEARQIGDGLTRDAVHALAAQVDAPAGATVVVNPTARAAHRARRGHRCRATVRCSVVDADGQAPGRRRSSARSAARRTRRWSPARRCAGCSTSCAAPSSPGARSPSFTITELDRPTACTTIVLQEAGPGDARRDLAELREQLLELGDARPAPCACAWSPRRSGACCSTPARSPGSAGRRFTARSTATPPAGAVTATDTTLANEHLRVEIDAATRHVRDRDGRRPARVGPRPAGRRRRRRRHLQLLAARRRSRRRHARRGPRHRRSSRARCAHACRSTPTTRGPRTRSATTGRASARSDETVAVTVSTTLELRAGERFLRVDARARQPGARPPAARALPAARHRSPAPTPSARSPSCTAGSPPRAACRNTACRRSRRAASSTRPTARPGSRSCTTACSSTRSSTTAASSRSRCCGRSATSPAPSRRCARNPAGPTVPVAGAQMPGEQRAEYAVLLHAGDWRAADCYAAADAFLVPFERARAAGTPTPTRAGDRLGAARRRRRGVGRAARRRAGSSSACSAPTPTPGPVTHRARRRARRGWVIDLRGRPRRAVRGHASTSAPGRSAPSNSTANRRTCVRWTACRAISDASSMSGVSG